MTAKTHLFADRITNITVGGGLVRIDLAVIDQVPSDANAQPTLEVTHRLTMPLDGFVKGLQVQQGVAEALVKAGVLKPAAQVSETAA